MHQQKMRGLQDANANMGNKRKENNRNLGGSGRLFNTGRLTSPTNTNLCGFGNSTMPSFFPNSRLNGNFGLGNNSTASNSNSTRPNTLNNQFFTNNTFPTNAIPSTSERPPAYNPPGNGSAFSGSITNMNNSNLKTPELPPSLPANNSNSSNFSDNDGSFARTAGQQLRKQNSTGNNSSGTTNRRLSLSILTNYKVGAQLIYNRIFFS